MRVLCFFSDASLIANYDVKRCYEVDITFHYQIGGGLGNNTTKKTKTKISNIFDAVSKLIPTVSQCSGVTATTSEIMASPLGVSSIFFRIPLIFTASNSIADDQVSTKLTNCINTLKSNHKGFIDSRAPTITEGDVTHTVYNLSTISDKRSCCGGDIPPPCCAAGSINVSSTKCGKALANLFFTEIIQLSIILILILISSTFESKCNNPRASRVFVCKRLKLGRTKSFSKGSKMIYFLQRLKAPSTRRRL